jgi:hypothetical protein
MEIMVILSNLMPCYVISRYTQLKGNGMRSCAEKNVLPDRGIMEGKFTKQVNPTISNLFLLILRH